MDIKLIHRTLRIPLYKLFYIDDLQNFYGFSLEELKQFHIDYTKDEREHIITALEWAVNNPKFDFRSLLPGLQQPNESIYRYICILHKQLYSSTENRK
jgi:hypothetical protein